MSRELDLQLHPRVPPLVRSIPHVEFLSLFRAEESQEESSTCRGLRIGTMEELQLPESPETSPPADQLIAPPPVPAPSAQQFIQQSPAGPISVATNSATAVPPQADSVLHTLPQGPPHRQEPAIATNATAPSSTSQQETSIELPTYHIQPPPSQSVTTVVPIASSWDVPSSSRPGPSAMDEDEDDEPMPTINKIGRAHV